MFSHMWENISVPVCLNQSRKLFSGYSGFNTWPVRNGWIWLSSVNLQYLHIRPTLKYEQDDRQPFSCIGEQPHQSDPPRFSPTDNHSIWRSFDGRNHQTRKTKDWFTIYFVKYRLIHRCLGCGVVVVTPYLAIFCCSNVVQIDKWLRVFYPGWKFR